MRYTKMIRKVGRRSFLWKRARSLEIAERSVLVYVSTARFQGRQRQFFKENEYTRNILRIEFYFEDERAERIYNM